MKKILAALFGFICLCSPFSVNASALLFTGASTDSADFGTLRSYGMNPVTVMMWIKPTVFTAPRRLWAKQNTTFLICQWMTTGAGDIRCRNDRTANQAYDTTSSIITANKWYFVAMTFSESASAGNFFHIYMGSPTQPLREATYATKNDGSGTWGDYTGNNFTVGNSTGLSQAPDAVFSSVMVVNRVMSMGEIRNQMPCFRPVPGTILLSQLGFNGTGRQADWSGNRNNGTITGTRLVAGSPTCVLIK